MVEINYNDKSLDSKIAAAIASRAKKVSADYTTKATENVCATELAWVKFCGRQSMPTGIRILCDHFRSKITDSSLKLCEALKIFDTNPESKLWDDLLGKEKGIESLISIGAVAIKFRKVYFEEFTKQMEGRDK